MNDDALCPVRDKWRGGLADLPFEPYKEDQWPVVITRSAPAGQSIRVSAPRLVLDTIAAEYGLGASPGVAEYGLVVRAAASDGSRAVFQVDRFASAQPGDDPNRFYFSVIVPGQWDGEPASLDDIDPLYDGVRAPMSGEALQTKLTVELWAHDDEEPRAVGVLDFTAPDIKDIELYPSSAGEEHIHVISVDLFGGVFRLVLLRHSRGLRVVHGRCPVRRGSERLLYRYARVPLGGRRARRTEGAARGCRSDKVTGKRRASATPRPLKPLAKARTLARQPRLSLRDGCFNLPHESAGRAIDSPRTDCEAAAFKRSAQG